MSKDLIHFCAREGFHRCVVTAVERLDFDLASALASARLTSDSDSPRDQSCALETFQNIFDAVDWTLRESILPLVPVFEAAYNFSPRNFSSEHRYIDANLDLTHLQMKNGSLVKLPPGEVRKEEWRYSKRNIIHYRKAPRAKI